jgi:hypothetical protein
MKGLIAPELGMKLEQEGRRADRSEWKIGDLAHEVLTDIQARQEVGKLPSDIPQHRIWSAIGQKCRRSGKRVRVLWQLGQTFPEKLRTRMDGLGYYERIFYELDSALWGSAMDFYDYYVDLHACKPDIGEFIYLYNSQGRGRDYGEGAQGVSTGGGSWTRPFWTLLNLIPAVLPRLDGGGEGVRRLREGVDIVREALPVAMEELGIAVRKKVEG